MSENKTVVKGSKKGLSWKILEEKRLDCGLYFYCTGHTRSACVLYLAIYPKYLVQF